MRISDWSSDVCSSDLDGDRLVGAEIVHDDDVAGFEHGHELLLDIGPEALAVDRPVEDARRRQPIAAQRAEEGQRAPVAMRGEAAQALAAGRLEERRVGKEGVRTGRSGGPPYP